MNYAYPSNHPFSTSKPIQRKTKMTDTMRNQREFAKTHKVSIQVDPKTGAVQAQVTQQEVLCH
jgi:hypothetical protein